MDKLKIFISSRTKELHNERVAIKQVLAPFGFEVFLFEDDVGARTESVPEVYRKEVSECDLYIGIFREEHSEATEEEYKIALSQGKEILIYISDYNVTKKHDGLNALLTQMKSKHSIETFTDSKELEKFIKRDITNLLVRKFKQIKEGAVLSHTSFGNMSLIQHYLTSLTPTNPDPLIDINQVASEIISIWNAMGYKIVKCTFDNTTINFECEIKDWKRSDRLCIRCVDGEITTEDVDYVKQFLDVNPQYSAFIFTHSRISQSAKDLASKFSNITLQTQGEFYRSVMSPEKYIERISNDYKSSQIPKCYVTLNCFKEIITEDKSEYVKEDLGDLDTYVDKWFEDRSKKHLSILGEFGSGKTWFSKQYAVRYIKKYLDNPHINRLPIFISLRDYAKSYSIKQLITDLLLNDYGFSLPSFDVFQELNRQGRFLLVFDGFDEMAQKVDYEVVVQNFNELAKVAVSNSKVLLTCRTTHFRYERESRNVLSGKERTPAQSLVTNQPGFEIINLEEFSDDKIVEVMAKIMGDPMEAKLYWERLKPIYDIPSIAHKPVLIPMLIDVMPQIVESSSIDAASIYRIYTERWISRSHEEGRTYLKTKWLTLYFMKELAWSMIKSQNLKIFWKDIPKFIDEYFNIDSKELDYYAHDLQSNTFLKRDHRGVFEFTHKSMTEFFVAYKFALELGAAKNEYIVDIPPDSALQLSVSELTKTFGYTPLTNEIIIFLKDMISDKTILKEIFSRSKQSSSDSSYLNSNLITILLIMKESFDSEDISRANLPNAELENSSFTNCNFDYANLSKCNMEKIVLHNSKFNNSNLAGSIIVRADCRKIKGENVDLSNCNCLQSDFHGSELLKSNISNTSFVKANLSSSNLEDCIMRSSDFTDSNLTESVLDGSTIDNCIFDEADLINSSIKNATITNCTFHNSVTEGIEFTNSDLSNSDLEGLNLTKVGWGKAKLIHTTLIGSDLSGSRFTEANLTDCNLERAILARCKIEKSIFINAKLESADLSHSKFIGCNMQGANLERIKSEFVEIDENTVTSGVKIDRMTFLQLPNNFQKILIRDNPELSGFYTEGPKSIRKST